MTEPTIEDLARDIGDLRAETTALRLTCTLLAAALNAVDPSAEDSLHIALGRAAEEAERNGHTRLARAFASVFEPLA